MPNETKTINLRIQLEALRWPAQDSKPAAALACEPGVRRNQFYKWCRENELRGEQDAFGGSGRNEAKIALFEFIEVFYNRQRSPQELGYKTPVKIEQEYRLVA